MTSNGLPLSYQHELSAPLLGHYRKQDQITNKNVFKISKEDLTLFFEKKNIKLPDNDGESRISLNILRDCGYSHGLCRLLNSDKETGIVGDKQDILRRQNVFGKHTIAMPAISTFWNLLSRNFEDSNVIFLTWAASIYLILSLLQGGSAKYIESLTIYFGLFFSAMISSVCDWIKEKQYIVLLDEINNQMVTVYRGAYGTVTSIPIRELVVGDIVDINQGDRVPADCILLEEMNITVDQKIYFPNDYQHSVKEQSAFYGQGNEDFDNHKLNPDPFLFVDSKIMSGQGKALVCAVGQNTMLARYRKQGSLKIEEQETFLEQKLQKLSKYIGQHAKIASIICFLCLVLFNFAFAFFGSNENSGIFSGSMLLQIGNSAIISVVLLMVAIPEGLPVAVSIAMALSVNNLKKDNILIKNLEAIQTCATLHDICVGKTGTLTTGDMRVTKFHFCDNVKSLFNSKPDSFNEEDSIHPQIKDLIKEAIVSNTDVRIENNDDVQKSLYVPKGQPLEVSMIQFLFDNEEEIPNIFINRNKYTPKIVQLPFEQNLKRKIVIREINGNPQFVRVYVKGAPEFIIPMCTKTLDKNVQPKNLLRGDHQQLLSQNVSKDMAQEGLKVLTYAFKQIPITQLNELLQQYNQETTEFREQLESGLIYLATFGLEDPIRPNIKNPIELIKFGSTDKLEENKNVQVNVRMITGDHIETAKYVAEQCGIISSSDKISEVAMTGDQFREAIGSYEKIWDENRQQYIIKFQSSKQFDEVKKKVRIIARCTPEDKFLLVSGINQKGGLVAMAGDSIADAEALKKADVGLCMGSGCDVAKDNSDLVILDNNFQSIQTAIQWGRTIYDNVRKFLQFQLTVNVSLVIVTIIGSLFLGHPPLNVLQMLWINLIMDTLGAIAIGTEPYKKQDDFDKNLKQTRISRKDKILLLEMWRQILVQAIYQIVVMVVLMFFGGLIFFEEVPNLIYTPLRDSQTHRGTTRLVLDTICFHTFFLMNLFNMINCRILEKDEINIFKNILNNWHFWVIFGVELLIQQFMISSGSIKLTITSALLGTGPLTSVQQIVCWVLGAFSLIVNLILKKIPVEQFEFVNHFDVEPDKDKQLYFDKYKQQFFDTQKNYLEKIKDPEE